MASTTQGKDKLALKQVFNVLKGFGRVVLILIRNYSACIAIGFSISYWRHGYDLAIAIEKDMTATLLLSSYLSIALSLFEILILNNAGFTNVYSQKRREEQYKTDIVNSVKEDMYPDIKEYIPWYINKLREQALNNKNKN